MSLGETQRLTQRFDIELQFNNAPLRTSPDADPDDGTGPSLREAIAEQLGLQIEDGRTQLDVIVIDHVKAPSAN